jgi:Fe-S cluster assembly protein SufD
MVGESATMVLNGAYLLRDQQEATIAPVVDHLTTGCQTHELLKGVLAGQAHGVFQGTLIVHPGRS